MAAAGQRPGSRTRPVAAWVMALCALSGIVTACGKKGPPLPPIVRLPTPPPDFAAERRGEEVTLRFTVPSSNTNGTRPADVERMDIYRFTGPASATDDEVVKLGTKVASVPVKKPVNPDATTEADEPAEEPDLVDEGLAQGSVAALEDAIVPAASTPVQLKKRGRKGNVEGASMAAPLVGPPSLVSSTIYTTVGINTKGRRGPLSRRIAVPLVAPPQPPSTITIAYDEGTIRVTWTGSASEVAVQPPATAGLLPGRTFGIPTPVFSYHVYDVSPSTIDISATNSAAPVAGQVRLTQTPIAATEYDDTRIAWGTTRCYAVRTVETLGELAIESGTLTPSCTTLKDTFPPSPPKDLRAVAAEGVISLIWEPNPEKDLRGYLVLRGPSEDALVSITPMPTTNTTFNDAVAAGTRYVYAVQAVDTAGNISARSSAVEDRAR